MILKFTRQFVCIVFFLCMLPALKAQQTGSITGKIADTAGKYLPGADILLRNEGDTMFRKAAISSANGSYSFQNLPVPGTYVLSVSYQGYIATTQKLALSAQNPQQSVPLISLYPSSAELNGVVVKSVIPVNVKGDTTEFNAEAYHLKPNATAEDLLKKLPGLDVDESGAVKAQGESVSRVYVNGKRFFGDDPKTATQNLPSDVVDKVQVFDALSDQSAFSGFDDGNRVKTINIITKKDKSTGYFGKTFLGGGTKGLYTLGTATHRFNGDQQISLIAQANNTNQQMFTMQDIFGSQGGGRPGGSGGMGGPSGGGPQGPSSNNASNNSGITKTWAAGLNYRDTWGKKTQVSGSYFFNKKDNNIESATYTEQLFNTDSTQISNQTQKSLSQNINHRINLNIETQFDSSNAMIIRPNISIQNTQTQGLTNTDIALENIADVSRTNASTSNHNSGYNGSIDMLFQHKFQKKGRTFSVGETISGNNKNGKGKTYTLIDDIATNDQDTTNQYYKSNMKGTTYSTTLSYTEPIAQNQQLELNVNNSYTKNKIYRNTFNYDSSTNGYTLPDSLLTNAYENTYVSNRATLSYRYNNGKLNFSFGGGIQLGTQRGNNTSKDIHISRNYTNFYPTANLNYRISTTRNLRFNYQGRTTQPSVDQLQPVVDNSDQLNVSSGNPDLKQSFAHSVRFLYTSFDRENLQFMDASLNASLTQNNIVNSITRLSNGGQYTIPVNLNGNYSINGHFNYTFPIHSIPSNLSFSSDITSTKTAGLINDLKNFTYNHSFAERIKWTSNLSKTFDINLSTQPSYTIARYTLQPTENANYFSQSMAVEGTWYTQSGWILSSTFNYTYYKGLSAGYNVSIPLLNASFSKQLFKNKAGEIKLSVYDLLDQNKSITNTRTDNAITQVKSNVLTRYALLTFTYNLRNFGKKMPSFFNRGGGDKNDMPGPPPGGGGGMPPMGPPPGM